MTYVGIMKKPSKGTSEARVENLSPHFPNYSSRMPIVTVKSYSVGNGEPKNTREVSLADCFLELLRISLRVSEGCFLGRYYPGSFSSAESLLECTLGNECWRMENGESQTEVSSSYT